MGQESADPREGTRVSISPKQTVSGVLRVQRRRGRRSAQLSLSSDVGAGGRPMLTQSTSSVEAANQSEIHVGGL